MNTTYEGSNRLMFITNRTDQYTEQQETQWVLEGGCRWIVSWFINRVRLIF